MSVLIIPCETCAASTPHRIPTNRAGLPVTDGSRLKCDVCGTLRPAPDLQQEGELFATNAARVIATIPSLSQKQAQGKLEELLYEGRDAIVNTEAFQDAVAATNAPEFEMQDIKVQSYERGQGAWIVNFSFYALGDGEADIDDREFRIDGSGVGIIDDRGNVEISELVATAAP
jgi:uncharacterized Zn finger protein